MYDVCDDRKKLWVKDKTLDEVATVSLASWRCYPLWIPGACRSLARKFAARVYPLVDMRLENVFMKLYGGRCAGIRTYRVNIHHLSRPGHISKNGMTSWRRTPTQNKQQGNWLSQGIALWSLFILEGHPCALHLTGILAAVPQIGDCIVILSGGEFLFVLRPVDDRYRLLGPMLCVWWRDHGWASISRGSCWTRIVFYLAMAQL